ncbi:hypothetical protein [Lapidilactobacillus luobeiensis]|uniref:hypothetical protein n=1 Tax=Lapidilactobacillus luobeiensis TaxID=2950371 RepID=UPI0021C2F5FB|nr:hypothetical protein [Lapidilactobacillus luobeiensis]
MTEATKKMLKYTLIGFANGLAIGTAAAFSWHLKEKQLPESLLEEIKSLFLKEGPIEGSWIESTPRTITWRGDRHLAFFGGITREESHALVQYQFIFDAKTKELLDLKKEALA